MNDRVGVGGMSLYVPACRVRLEDWCAWSGASWDKVQNVVGRSFRMADRHESVYTMAANAVLRLILAYDVDPQRVGMLALGTESSTDNSAGAVIVRGMVDDALRALGRPPLSRSCEVPELKHACLGGMYALKGALRYLAAEAGDEVAIVVSADMAEYARGSSGEPTQGAGALAMLVERDPALFSVDLKSVGSASSYRGPDFRKPQRRHFMAGYAANTTKMHDFPVFNGKYSTTCYIDAVVHAVGALIDRQGTDAPSFYEDVDGVLFHRPYHKMPADGFGALYVFGLAAAESRRPELEALCEAAEVPVADVLAERASTPDLFAQVLAGRHDADAYPATMRLVKAFRRTETYRQVVLDKLALGSDRMKDLGNLYTAALPAWIAAAFEEALETGRELEGRRLLAVGYGSGDAAEAMLLQPAARWREAAAKIGFDRALERHVDLTQTQYEALHDAGEAEGLVYETRGDFRIDRIGETDTPEFSDLGMEYYRFDPPAP